MSKYLAFLAYLLSAVGAAFVLLARRNDRFAVYHARQSLGLLLVAVGVLLAWIVVGWALAWIPYIGFIVAMALFALVIAAYLALTVCWFMGMHYAGRKNAAGPSGWGTDSQNVSNERIIDIIENTLAPSPFIPPQAGGTRGGKLYFQ